MSKQEIARATSVAFSCPSPAPETSSCSYVVSSFVRRLLAYCSAYDVSGDTISETQDIADTLTLNFEIASHLDTPEAAGEEEEEEEDEPYLPILSELPFVAKVEGVSFPRLFDYQLICYRLRLRAVQTQPRLRREHQKDKQALDGDERKQSRPFVHSFRIDSATFVCLCPFPLSLCPARWDSRMFN